MRVLVACKRGNIAERDRSGHCLCVDCKAFKAEYRKQNSRTQYAAEWQRNNKDKVAQYQKTWLTANSKKRRAIEAAWKRKNPEKVAAYSAKAGAKWASENKGKRLASVRARQIAQRHRTPVWADLGRIAEIYQLAAQKTKETGVPHEVDHVLPLQGEYVSGLHVHTNLQVLSRSANRSKGVKTCEF